MDMGQHKKGTGCSRVLQMILNATNVIDMKGESYRRGR
jgi:hypothetical protein